MVNRRSVAIGFVSIVACDYHMTRGLKSFQNFANLNLYNPLCVSGTFHRAVGASRLNFRMPGE